MQRDQQKLKPVFLGIDQTGAVKKDGTPKPLDAILLKENQLFSGRLEALTASAIRRTFAWQEIPSNLTIVADCVLGLPEGVSPSFREALSMAGKTNSYGRLAAQKFFGSLKKNEPLPRREVEIRHKANSVFQTHPFQKNIQTGTFRIWKDLASEPGWFHFPFLDPGNQLEGIPIFEGYPSLSWKQLFGVKKRTPKQLPELIQIHFPEIHLSDSLISQIQKNPNLADAAVLALAGKYWLEGEKVTWSQYPKASSEGWILGAD